MKMRRPILELCVTAVLALLSGFFLAAGARLDGGGYLGYGVEHAATSVYLNWREPGIYLEILLYALLAFAALMLLWRALDRFAQARVKRLLLRAERVKKEQLVQSVQGVQRVLDTQNIQEEPNAQDTQGAQGRQTAVQEGQANQHCLPIVLVVKKRWFWITALLLLCCWLPYWLGLWPGIYNYDAHYQYEMVVGGYLQTHHPLIHTLLLDAFVLLGEHFLGGVNTGVALYIGLCLIVCALAFSWMLRTMAEEGAGKPLLVCSFLFLAINPALVIWLVSTNKDVLFTACLLLAALVLYRACRLRPWELWGSTQKGTTLEARARIMRIGAGVATALFFLLFAVLCLRTSAAYSLLVFLPFAAFLIRRRLRVRLMSVLISATALFLVLYLVVVQAILQVPSGPWQPLDALSIPRQQLARVWAETSDPVEIAAFQAVFDEEALEQLDEYEADDADTSRSAFRTPFEQDPEALFALYLRMGLSHPGAYTDAALLTSYEAWYPGAVIDGYFYPGYFPDEGVDRASYIDVSAFSPAEEAWILEDFGAWLRSFGLGNIGLESAPVRLLCSPAVYMWILLIALARTVCLRNRSGALVCTFLLAFGLTALLSPLVVMRYFLMVMAALPLICHLMTSPSWKYKKAASGMKKR